LLDKGRITLVVVNEIGEPYTVQPDLQDFDFDNVETQMELLGDISDLVYVMTQTERAE